MKITKKDLKKLIVEEIKRSLLEAEQKEAVEEVIEAAKEEAIKSADEDPQALQQKSDAAMAKLPPEAQQVIQQMLDNIDSEIEKESGVREALSPNPREHPDTWKEFPDISSHRVIRKIANDITVPDPGIYKNVRMELIVHYLKEMGANAAMGTIFGGGAGIFTAALTASAGAGFILTAAGVALGAGLAAKLMIKDAEKMEKEALWRTRKIGITKKFNDSEWKALSDFQRRLLGRLQRGDWDLNWHTGDYQMDLYRTIFDEPE